MKDNNKKFLEMTDAYKHLLGGLKYNNLTLDDLKEIDELIINLSARNQVKKGSLCAEVI